jgi:heterodisulfide reductase subunit A2
MAGIKYGDVAVIGAGVAGIAAAVTLKQTGIEADLYERDNIPGGHILQWHELFPDRTDAQKVLLGVQDAISANHINILTNSDVVSVEKENGYFKLITSQGRDKCYKAIIFAGGFTLFDASRKEEYGYGVYPFVITSAELEKRLEDKASALLIGGKPPRKIAFVHCVGSRDAKTGNLYCSRVCCITGVKQAIDIRELYPECEVMNFYMDLRMFGMGYEELYQEAQEKYGVTFIRGRVSEAAPTISGAIQVKAEDTLLGSPLKVEVDWMILLVGMEPDKQTTKLAEQLALECDSSGFLKGSNKFLHPGCSSEEGIFMAGSCAGPASIPDSVNQGRAAAVSVIEYLSPKS